jgi:hypothetical protein
VKVAITGAAKVGIIKRAAVAAAVAVVVKVTQAMILLRAAAAVTIAGATTLQAAVRKVEELRLVMPLPLKPITAIHRRYLLHRKRNKMTGRHRVLLKKKKGIRKIPIQTRIFQTGH